MQQAVIEGKIQDWHEKSVHMQMEQELQEEERSERQKQEEAEAAAADKAANSMPVIAQVNTMIINTTGPNVIGNEEDQQEPPLS